MKENCNTYENISLNNKNQCINDESKTKKLIKIKRKDKFKFSLNKTNSNINNESDMEIENTNSNFKDKEINQDNEKTEKPNGDFDQKIDYLEIE